MGRERALYEASRRFQMRISVSLLFFSRLQRLLCSARPRIWRLDVEPQQTVLAQTTSAVLGKTEMNSVSVVATFHCYAKPLFSMVEQ